MAQQVKQTGITLTPRTIGAIIVGLAAVVSAVVAVLAFVRQSPPPPPSYGYTAKIPGPTCDTGNARWVEAPRGDSTCLSDRLSISADPALGIGQVFVYGDRKLPTDNKVSV
jgi:hypothetical protein